MVARKTATLTVRIEPVLKEKLGVVAKKEHRSLANMIEVMIRDYCRREGIDELKPESPSR
jgi:predicted transcriptional regulator